ncbi:unnamed protein product [Lupinus luteus]|uniref:Uncharacterized protein n=1 Tax=Lupinus luteus TaxID=3873 RepID=A0AAV1WBD9_LUPLU
MVVTRRVNRGLQWNGPRYASLFPEHRSMSVSFSQWQLLSPTTTFGKCGVIHSTSAEVKDSGPCIHLHPSLHKLWHFKSFGSSCLHILETVWLN